MKQRAVRIQVAIMRARTVASVAHVKAMEAKDIAHIIPMNREGAAIFVKRTSKSRKGMRRAHDSICTG